MLSGGTLVAILKMFGDDFAGRIFTTTAAGSNGKLALHFEQ
jgi:hypothetical protein